MRKAKTYKYIALAALALGFTACSQDDGIAPQQEDIVKIASANIATEVQTRVNTTGNGTIFENGDLILLVNNSRTTKNSATYTYDGTDWSLYRDIVLYASGTDATNDFTAYYPLYKDFTLPTDQSNEALISSADRMVATATGVAKGDAVVLSFVRQNAMVTITPSLNTEFGDDAVITDLQIAGITPYHPTDAEYYKAIIEPSATGFTVSVSVSGVEQPLTATTSTVIEAGKHYSFNLTVGKTAVGINSVSVEPWGDGGALEGGVAEEILDATGLSANELNAAVTKALEAGDTDLTIILAPDASAEMFTAIRRALIDTDGVADGSINLTLGGVTSIPDHSEFAINESIIFGNVIQDENGESLDELEAVLELNSINLPDVVTIGESAFGGCENLVSVTAPKVQTVGQSALGWTALTSVEFPELTTIPYGMFNGTYTLTSAKFPKVTTIEHGGLLIGALFSPDNNPTPFPLELTAEGDITFNGNSHFNVESQNYSGKIDLVLHSNKSGEVNGLTWKGYTFKSIEFLCTDGTTNHTYGAAVNNGDGTHTYTCTTCNLTKVESCHGEATCKESATCEACGVQFGELSDHILDPATGYCKFGCETWMATFTIEAEGNTTYYKDMDDFTNQELADGSVVTLLADETSFGWGVRGDYTLDLNGYDLTTETYSIYAGVSSEITEVGIVNSTDERSSVPYIRVSNCTLKIGDKVDVAKMILFFTTCTVDLTNADFSSCELNLNLDGCNTSQFVLGNYAIYNASNNVVTGELTKSVTYTIKAAQ